MMSDSVERWLQTFSCSHYSCLFEAYGFKTLHSVCNLQLPQLLAMGVPRNHCEKILENVNNLRQTMFGQIPKPGDCSIYPFNKYNSSLNPAVWTLKTVAMNANYRGINPYQDEYGSFAQSGNNMQNMGFHQGSYENSNMVMLSSVSGAGAGGYPVPGYDSSQNHMMLANHSPMSAHSAAMYQQSQQAYMAQQQQYYANNSSGNAGSSGGQYTGQAYSLGGSNQYYNSGNNQGHNASASKMVPPPHHHLRNTSGQQNPQQVADNILQMASSFPSHHTVQVPLKNRHAPYQIPRSPQNYYPEKCGGPQQGMGMQGSQSVPNSQQSMSAGQLQPKTSQSQQGQMVQASGMGQAAVMMYSGSSPHSQMPPRSSPMSPLMMHSPGALQSSSSVAVCSPVSSSPGLASMRSPCSVSMRSPAHMTSGYPGQPIHSPPQRSFTTSDSSAAGHHCSPTSMHSPASHGSSPYTPASMVHQVSSPPHPQPHVYSAPVHSPYKMDLLMDSGQGPGVQGSHVSRGQNSDPLQSLQKLVMLPERQVVDPKSVVSDGCLQNCDESSKNFDGPAEQSREVEDCSAGVYVIASSPPASDVPLTVTGFDGNKFGKSFSPASEAANQLYSTTASANQNKGSSPSFANSGNSVNKNISETVPLPENRKVEWFVPESGNPATPYPTSSDIKSPCEKDSKSNFSISKADVQDISTSASGCSKSPPPSAVTKELELTAAGSSETQDRNPPKSNKIDKSSAVHCNGLVTLPKSEAEKADMLISNVEDSSKGIVLDGKTTESNIMLNNLSNFGKCALTTKTSLRPSPPKKRHSQRLLQASSAKAVPDSSAVKAVCNTAKDAFVNKISVDSLCVLQPSHSSSKSELVNGFSEKCITGVDSDGAVISKKKLLPKNHIPVDTIAETKLVTRCKSKEWVPVLGTCVVTAVGGAENGEPLTSCNAVELSETESESGIQSNVSMSFAPEKVSCIDTFCCSQDYSQHPASDNEDDRFSNGLDFGYDSPPCEMVGDDSWESDMEKRLSTNGVDEAGESGGRSENKLHKSSNLRTRSTANSSPAKDTPAQSTRAMTRSTTGRASKRKVEETNISNAKKPRQSSGASSRSNDTVSLSMECDEIDTRESFSDVEVISSSDESSMKNNSLKNKTVDEKRPQNNKQYNLDENSCRKSPVVLLTKPSGKNSFKLQNSVASIQKPIPDHHKSMRRNAGHLYAVRGDKGRFISREQIKFAAEPAANNVGMDTLRDRSGGKGRLRSRHINSATVPISTAVNSDTDDEPLISVRRSSKEEMSSVHTQFKSDVGKVQLREEPVFISDDSQSMTVNENAYLRINSDVPCSSIPLKNNTTSHQRSDFSTIAPIKSESITSKTKRKPKKAARNKNSKKIIKSKKNKAHYFNSPECADDSFKNMKLSKTFNHLQSKKKIDSSQSNKSFSPFVRIQGKRMLPSSVSVFNQPPASTKDVKTTNKKKTSLSTAAVTTTVPITNFSSDKTVMLPSTKTTEASWVCALCGKRSSYRFLGDLFGPYFLESHLSALTKSPSEGGKHGKQDTTGLTEIQSVHNTRRKSLGYRRTGSVEESVVIPQEVWVHEDCAMWSSGVYVVGSRIYGLEEALKAATCTVCACCREKGAMVGCLHKGCNQNFHYMCAVDKMCFLDVENFSMLCPKHKDKRLKSVTAPTSKS